PYAREVMRMAPKGSVPWVQAVSTLLMSQIQLDQLDGFLETVGAVTTMEPSADSPFAWTVAGFTWMVAAFYLDTRGLLEQTGALIAKMHASVDPIAEHEPLAMAWLGVTHGARDAFAKEDPFGALVWSKRSNAIFTRLNHWHVVMGSRRL